MSISHAGIVTAVLLVVSGTVARAHDTAPIDRTQAYQLQQIQEARRNGALTRREYEARMADQVQIADMERRAQAHGVTGRDFHAIRDAQRDAAAAIDADSTNNRVNVWRRWRTRHD